MDDVLTQQAATEQEITIIDNVVNDMTTLGDKAAANATGALNFATNTLSNAQLLLREAAVPLDEVNANETKGKTMFESRQKFLTVTL